MFVRVEAFFLSVIQLQLVRLRVKLRAITVPNLIPYNKTYLSSTDLCAKLQGQGLTINDVAKAKKNLNVVVIIVLKPIYFLSKT